MAIVYNNSSCSCCAYCACPWAAWNVAFTVNAGEDRIMLAAVRTSNRVGGGAPNVVQYAGQNMTYVPPFAGWYNTFGNEAIAWWYLLNPPVGTANFTFSHTINCVGNTFAGLVVYNNVDQGNPFAGNAVRNTFVGGNVSLTVPCTEINLVTGHAYRSSSNPTPAVVSGETMRCCVGGACGVCFTGTSYYAHGVADQPGASPSITWDMAFGGGNQAGMAVALNPALVSAGRQVKYFYDFWAPEPKVRDDAGRIVPLNEIRPNNWIEAEGLALPSLVPAENNIVDPSRSRIVEVNADDRQGTIKTDISQFADVLIARAAAGRG